MNWGDENIRTCDEYTLDLSLGRLLGLQPPIDAVEALLLLNP